MRSLGDHCDTFDDRNWDGFDSERRGICSLPGFQGTLEPKVDGVGHVETWVLGPHTQERLGNAPYVILNRSRLDGIAVGSKVSGVNSLGEDL